MTSTLRRSADAPVHWTRSAIAGRSRRVLAGVELVTGAAALVGGALLAAAPWDHC